MNTTIPAALLTDAGRTRHIAVLTGAGMSAASGVPTFRDAMHGLWADFDPQDLATPQAWRAHRDRVWAWYEWRRARVMAAQPHAGHFALATMARQRRISIVTQNVDDLHERAGSSEVVHLHGSLFAPRCDACGQPGEFDPQVLPPIDAPVARLQPPRCAHCAGFLRPGVVWFGEMLPQSALNDASALMGSADLVLVVGTSAIVQPAASLPLIAVRRGTPVWMLDPDADAYARLGVGTHWATGAEQGLPALVRALDG